MERGKIKEGRTHGGEVVQGGEHGLEGGKKVIGKRPKEGGGAEAESKSLKKLGEYGVKRCTPGRKQSGTEKDENRIWTTSL